MSALLFEKDPAMPSDEAIASLIWHIKHFDFGTKNYFSSPKFRVGLYDFKLHLHPFGRHKPNCVTARLYMLNNGAKKVYLQYKITVLPHIKKSYTWEFWNSSRSQWYGASWIYLLERGELLNEKRSSFLQDDTLTIRCDILSLEERAEHGTAAADQEASRDAETLSDDLSAILESGKYSDTVLVAGGQKFRVHRIILERRCPAIARRVNQAGKCVFEKVTASDLQTILRYLYTGTFDMKRMNCQLLSAFTELGASSLGHSLLYSYHTVVEVTSVVPVFKLSFTWLVKDFSRLLSGAELECPAYCVSGCEWGKMGIALKGEKSDDGSAELQLKFKMLGDNDVGLIRCKVTVSDNGSVPRINEHEHLLRLGSTEWTMPTLKVPEDDKHFHNDTLRLFFEISTSKRATNLLTEELSEITNGRKKLESEIKSLKRLQGDLWFGSNSSELSDITLCAGDEKFFAHKVFLGARSPVFAQMFEKEGDTVVIGGLEPSTLSSLLQYIYCGHVGDMCMAKAVSLYDAAAKYKVLTLRDRCATFMKSSLSAADVGDVLLLADAHLDGELKTCAYDYIAQNPRTVLKNGKTMNSLKGNPQLYPELLEALLERYPFDK